jgi:hypothetical protein
MKSNIKELKSNPLIIEFEMRFYDGNEETSAFIEDDRGGSGNIWLNYSGRDGVIWKGNDLDLLKKCPVKIPSNVWKTFQTCLVIMESQRGEY